MKPLNLANIYNLSPNEDGNYDIPYVCTGNGAERLNRILGAVHHRLAEYPLQRVVEAWEDILRLYRWFFDKKAEEIQRSLKVQFNNNIDALIYMDVDRFVNSRVNSIKEVYLSEVDVLNAILYEYEGKALADIECVSSQLSNADFFAVAALYHASIAMSYLETAKVDLANDLSCNLQLIPRSIEKSYDAILEAQVAIDLSELHYETNHSRNTTNVSGWIQKYFRSINKKASEARFGDRYEKRREKAYQLYEQTKDNFNNNYSSATSYNKKTMKISIQRLTTYMMTRE